MEIRVSWIVSWIVTGVVAALLAARLGYALYQDDGEFFESTPAPAPSDVRKTLPDGRRFPVLTRTPRRSRATYQPPACRARTQGSSHPPTCIRCTWTCYSL